MLKLTRLSCIALTLGACVPPQPSSPRTAVDLADLQRDAGPPVEAAPPEPAVAEPYRHKVLFSPVPLAADASNADQALSTWTLGQPLYLHAYGPAPKQVTLFAEVNGELATAGGAQLVRGTDAIANLTLDGGGPYPVQGPLGPGNVGAPTPYGVWSSLDDQADRVWSEMQNRIVPMLRVGDNTLTLVLSDPERTQEYARGTLTIAVPDQATLTAALSAGQEPMVAGDAKLLKAFRKTVEAEVMPKQGAGAAIVAFGYARADWEATVDDEGVLMQEARFTVIYRLPDDAHRARCRAMALYARRDASSKSGVVWDPPRFGGMGLETRWTPCPLAKK